MNFLRRALLATIFGGFVWSLTWLFRDYIGGPPRLLDLYILWSIELVAITLSDKMEGKN